MRTEPSQLSTGTGARGAIRFERQLATAFDVLIRSARTDERRARDLAGRCLAVWDTEPRAALELPTPTELHVGGKLGLDGASSGGAWVLSAFMAGVRRITRADARPEHLLELARALAALEATDASVRELQDWLWSDGAEGFEIAVHSSFMEETELAVALRSERARPTAVRGFGATPLDEAAQLASDELDVAVLHPELDVPLASYEQRASARAFEFSGDDLATLRRRCTAPEALAEAELDAIDELPTVRHWLAPATLARRLLARLELTPSVSNYARTARLAASDPRLGEALRSLLESEALGLALARCDEVDGTLERLVAEGADELRRGLLRGGARLPQLPAWWERAVLALPDGEGALHAASDGETAERLAAWALSRRPEALRGALAPLDANARLELLARLPATTAAALAALRGALLAALPQTDRELPLALMVAERCGAELCDASAVLARAVALGPALSATSAGRIARGIAARDSWRALLPDVVRSARAPVGLRLAALDALEVDAEASGAAVAFRLSAWLDPPDLKAALRARRLRLVARRA